MAVEAGHTSHLLDLLKTLNLRLEFINNFGGSNLVDLVKIANSALDDFYQNESLNNSIASGTDSQILHVGLGKNTQSVSQILLDLSLGGHTNLILCGFNLGLRYLFVALNGRLRCRSRH